MERHSIKTCIHFTVGVMMPSIPNGEVAMKLAVIGKVN